MNGLRARVPDVGLRSEREIERVDREMDELVYELYGLTEEERRVVEEVTQ